MKPRWHVCSGNGLNNHEWCMFFSAVYRCTLGMIWLKVWVSYEMGGPAMMVVGPKPVSKSWWLKTVAPMAQKSFRKGLKSMAFLDVLLYFFIVPYRGSVFEPMLDAEESVTFKKASEPSGSKTECSFCNFSSTAFLPWAFFKSKLVFFLSIVVKRPYGCPLVPKHRKSRVFDFWILRGEWNT